VRFRQLAGNRVPPPLNIDTFGYTRVLKSSLVEFSHGPCFTGTVFRAQTLGLTQAQAHRPRWRLFPSVWSFVVLFLSCVRVCVYDLFLFDSDLGLARCLGSEDGPCQRDQQVTRTCTRQQNKPLTRHTNTERAQTTPHEHQASNGATTLNSQSSRRRPQAAAQRCASALGPALLPTRGKEKQVKGQPR